MTRSSSFYEQSDQYTLSCHSNTSEQQQSSILSITLAYIFHIGVWLLLMIKLYQILPNLIFYYVFSSLSLLLFILCFWWFGDDTRVRIYNFYGSSHHHHQQNQQEQAQLSLFKRVKFSTVDNLINRTWRITQMERLRLALCCATFMPIRFILLLLSLWFAAIFAQISLIGVSEADRRDKPLAFWRIWLQQPFRLCSRFIMFNVGYFWINIKGRQAAQSEAPIVVCNHFSFIDSFFLPFGIFASPVGAVEYISAPLFGSIVKALQAVFVDRHSATSRKDVLSEMLRRGQSTGWRQIVLFPEGTTTNGKALMLFKIGAFVPGLKVQPVLLSYKPSRVDHSWLAASPAPFKILIRMLCEPINYMNVEFMEPYTPQEAEIKNPQLYASNVRKLMCERAGIPWSDHSLEDVQLQLFAQKLKQPPEMGLIEFHVIKAQWPMVTLDWIKVQLTQFVSGCVGHTGTLTLSEFLKLHTPNDNGMSHTNNSDSISIGNSNNSDGDNGKDLVPKEYKKHNHALIDLFHLLDVNKCGEMTFRQYLMGVSMIHYLAIEDCAEILFHMLKNSTGAVNVGNMRYWLKQQVSASAPSSTMTTSSSSSSTTTIYEQFASQYHDDVDMNLHELIVLLSSSDNTQALSLLKAAMLPNVAPIGNITTQQQQQQQQHKDHEEKKV